MVLYSPDSQCQNTCIKIYADVFILGQTFKVFTYLQKSVYIFLPMIYYIDLNESSKYLADNSSNTSISNNGNYYILPPKPSSSKP